jgi:hemerythrin
MAILSLEWSEDLKTGIREIDNQHIEIIKRINSILKMTGDESEERILEAIRFFGGYIIEHFETEEKYMIEHNYPEYDFHKSEHMKFLKEFSRIKKQLQKAGEFSLIPIVVGAKSQAADWLIKHILSEDKTLAGYLKKRV